MKKWQMDRRAVLKAGGLSFALPLLEAMVPLRALAAGAGDPRRFVSVYIPSGSYIRANNGAYWYPSAAGPLNPASLPEVFKPFAANAKDFSIIRGLQNYEKAKCKGIGGGHSTAVATYATCLPYANGGASQCTIAGGSFDQEIAALNKLKAIAVSGGGYDGFHPDKVAFDYGRTISYLNGKQAETWLNPYKLFYSSGLFSGLPTGGTAPVPDMKAPALSRNKSILDNAYRSIQSLKNNLGHADRDRVEDYFSGLRELEKTLTSTDIGGGGTSGAASCMIANQPAASLNNEDHSGKQDDFPARLKAFCDIIVLAFKCNRAQVFSFMTEYENCGRQFRNKIPAHLIFNNATMNTAGSHIEMAHWADDAAQQTERRNRCVTRDRFYMSYVVYMINALKAAKDPSGSPILDNTIIQFGHGLMDGRHGYSENPSVGHAMVLAGGRNLINPGNFYVHDAQLKDLYYSLNNYLGMGMSEFRGSKKLLKL